MKAVFILCLLVVGAFCQDDNASFDSEDRSSQPSRLKDDQPSTVESPDKLDEKLPRATPNRTRTDNRTEVSGTQRVGPTFRAARSDRKLSWITNRTDESIRVFPTLGVGRANLWFNVSEVYLIYRMSFPWVSSLKERDKESDKNESIRDETSNTTMKNATFRADKDSDKDYHELARENIARFESRLNDLKAVVVESSGLQFFPVFRSGLDFRSRVGSRPRQQPMANQRMFVHPDLKQRRQMEPRFFETLRSSSDQPLFEPEMNVDQMPRMKIAHEDAFATYRILIGLDGFSDLVEDLKKFNITMRAIRLVSDKKSEVAASNEATSLAVDDAMTKADGVFDSLGLEYKGLYDFRIRKTRVPRLPLMPIRDNQIPLIKPITLPVSSHILLLLAY